MALMLAVIAAPSPSPTTGPTPLERFIHSGACGWVIIGLVALYVLMRIADRGSR